MIPCLHVEEFLSVPGNYTWQCHRTGKRVWVGQVPLYGEEALVGFTFLVETFDGKVLRRIPCAGPREAGLVVKKACTEILCRDVSKCRRMTKEFRYAVRNSPGAPDPGGSPHLPGQDGKILSPR